MTKVLSVILAISLAFSMLLVMPLSAEHHILKQFSLDSSNGIITYEDSFWDSFGENLIKDPTVAAENFDSDGKYMRYSKITADYQPVEINENHWWDKYLDLEEGFVRYYDWAKNEKGIQFTGPDENGYYTIPTGNFGVPTQGYGGYTWKDRMARSLAHRTGVLLRSGDQVDGVTYNSLTDDGSGVIRIPGANNAANRRLPLPSMEADSYYVVKFKIRNSENLANKCMLLELVKDDGWYHFGYEPNKGTHSDLGNLGNGQTDTVVFLVYTGDMAFSDPCIDIKNEDTSSYILVDDFGMYKVTAEYAAAQVDGVKLSSVGQHSSISGDINGDGEVDNKDLTRLFQYLSNWEVEVNEDSLDVNGDGSVDNKDLTRLFQYLSNWDVQIFGGNTVPNPGDDTVQLMPTPVNSKQNEEYFYNYESRFPEPTEELVSAPVTSSGMLNALKRAKQLIELTWTPTADTMPGFFNKDSKQEYFNYIEGKEYQGIPYSSVYETNTYVGSNCSIETYISASCNPNSYLYTKDLRTTCREPKAVTFYGMVCSKFVAYALGITETYNTKHFGDIPGMNLIASAGSINVNDILPADVLNNPGSHTAIITDVLRDTSGNVKYIEVSEETTVVKMRCRKWSVSDFLSHFGRYNLLRYDYLDSVEYQKSDFVNIFDENAELDDRKYDVLTRYGDKCNIDFSLSASRTVTFDILTDSWKEAVVYCGDTPISTIDVRNKMVFTFTPDNPGYYRVELKNGDRTSRPCYFCMYDAVLTVNPSGNNSFNVSYSSQTGEAVWFQLGEIGDSVYKKSNGSGNETVTYTENISNQKIRVAFENEYGVYLSSFEYWKKG